MNIIKEDILNIILVLFPILIYFIYNCYRELKSDKYNKMLFNLSLYMSLYLCIKYGYSNNYIKLLLFTNIPLLISYLKKENITSIIISLIILIYTKNILNKTITIIIIQYITYYLIFILCKKKNVKDQKLIAIISVLQGFFMSIEIFINPKKTAITILEIVISIIIFYIIPFILLYLYNLADNISSLYVTIKELNKEKQLYNSLFKITHEVKNPIAVCKGYLEMLDTNNQEKVNKYIPIIKQEINRSLNIMNDFMEFSKIKIEKDILDINILLEEISDELKILLKNKKIKMDTKIIKDEIYIYGDYNRLKQVFINIVKNSIESITEKGNISIITHILNNNYYIEITDNGCGMDDYTLNKVKEMFFTTKKQGTGLGVSLSNEIIKAHNGTLKYISREGKGTKVIVKLPIITI